MEGCNVFYVSSVGFLDGIVFGVGAVIGLALGIAISAVVVYLTR